MRLFLVWIGSMVNPTNAFHKHRQPPRYKRKALWQREGAPTWIISIAFKLLLKGLTPTMNQGLAGGRSGVQGHGCGRGVPDGVTQTRWDCISRGNTMLRQDAG